MMDLCLPCKEKGKLRVPYKTVGGVPMCGECVADHEQKQVRQAKPPEIASAPELDPEKIEETEMPAELCDCGKPLHHRGRCVGKARNAGTKMPAAHASSNGSFAVNLTAEGLDAVWNALPAEKKAELLGHL